jgi:hypothetical protein
MANLPLDACLTRAAIRNLRIITQHPAKLREFAGAFQVAPPEVPSPIVEWFRAADARGEFPQDILPLNME